MRLPARWRRVLLVAWDCLAWLVALVAFSAVRYDLVLTPAQWRWTVLYTGLAIALQVTVGLATQVYRGRSRTGSFSEAGWLGAVVLLPALPLGAALSLTTDLPRGLALTVPPMALVVMAAGRWALRLLLAGSGAHRDAAATATPALVYGAGEAGHQVARLVDLAADAPYAIVGYLDDDPAKRFLRVEGHRVLGTGADLARRAAERRAETVILAVSRPSPHLLQAVSAVCEQHRLRLVVIPPVREMLGGRMSLEGLRAFNVADLLGRRPVSTDLSAVAGYVADRVVLVTGAGGSIGSELARQLHRLGPRRLVLLDRDESALHATQLSIDGAGLLDTDDTVLCEIRDADALLAVFDRHRPDAVFHAAALKHLPMLERFPHEGWRTNVLGTLNVLRCAHAVGVGRVVNVSTDKAADPSSTLGRTKRVGERLTAWYAHERGLGALSVRFGNVLGSRGSVLYTFRAQIARGGPLTVTHPDVTRYFMTIPEACELVLQAGALGSPGGVLVLDMGEPVRILDVARRMMAEADVEVPIRYTGLRPGEKLHEVLFSAAERGARSVHPLIDQVGVPTLDPALLPQMAVGDPDPTLSLAEDAAGGGRAPAASGAAASARGTR
ncbi:polysaccharide biosynthesis protein [Propioniciclava coleopterorum]|uniref:Polysaccharide biosynthesis protein n=1 Tax=Propioniciclava coleopterorum TaxID=2714937 RepID=A0A6G7YAF0_9ACTN|nr:polysaccharide biosynthesis protein [Propioniciclava coleopterorum]